MTDLPILFAALEEEIFKTISIQKIESQKEKAIRTRIEDLFTSSLSYLIKKENENEKLIKEIFSRSQKNDSSDDERIRDQLRIVEYKNSQLFQEIEQLKSIKQGYEVDFKRKQAVSPTTMPNNSVVVKSDELQELQNYKKSCMCIECGIKTKDIVYDPCLHFLNCFDCAQSKEECPWPRCGKKIVKHLDIQF